MPEEGFAPMGGESAEDAPTSMTVEELVGAVSDSVAGRLSGRLDELEGRLDSVAGRLQVEGLAERLDGVEASLSAQMEEAALQAGELGPVLDEEIGPAIIGLVGQLLDLVDGDGDGLSDVAPLVGEIQANVADVAGALVHPAMTTDFADYTVLEALLLLLVVGWFVRLWIGALKEGFSWLS